MDSHSQGKNHAYGLVVDIYGKLTNNLSGYVSPTVISVDSKLKDIENAPVINIHDGATLENNNEGGLGIYLFGYAHINAGKATVNAHTGIFITSGSLNLNGTSVTGNGQKSYKVEGKTGASGSAIQIESNASYAGNIEVVIDGGTYTSNCNSALIEYVNGDTENKIKEIKILDGEFKSAEDHDTISIFEGLKSKKFITGGTFHKNTADGFVPDETVKTYLADDKVLDENGVVLTNHKITVNEVTKDNTDASKGHYTITTSNDSVTDTESISVKEKNIKIGVNFTTDSDTEEYLYTITAVDGEGNNITVAKDGTFIMPDSDVTVTITYSLKRYDITSDDERVQLNENSQAKKGDKVEIEINSDAGYKVGSVTVTPAATGSAFLAELTGNKASFTMPGTGVSISVEYVAIKYNLTKRETTNGAFTLSKTEGFADEEIVVEAKPNEGYTVDEITYSYEVDIVNEEGITTTETKIEKVDVTNNTGKFIIPIAKEGKPIVVTVTFKEEMIDDPKPDIKEFNITTEATNGSVEVVKTAQVGDEVTAIVKANEGYEIENVTLNGETVEVVDGKITFTMPDSDVTITATFKEKTIDDPKPDIKEFNITTEATNGSVEVVKTAQVGDEVTAIIKANEGYEIENVTLNSETVEVVDGKITFTMPDSDVTITATFKETASSPRPEENLSILTDNGVSFDGGEEFTKEEYELKAIKVEKTEKEIEKMVVPGFNYLTTYDLSVLKDGKVVKMVNGSYKISIPVENLYDTYKVAYIDGGKVVEELDATYENGHVVFTTTHLSEYAVYGRKKETANNVPVVNPQTGDSILNYFTIAVLSIGALGISVKKYGK